MKSDSFVKQIRNYAIASFLVPIIAINSCFALYKFLGNFDIYPNIDWGKEKIEYKKLTKGLIEKLHKLSNQEIL